MKAAIIGGGPSGLFLSILLKRAQPDASIAVYEQNSADATFGFGVVMADTGLAQLRHADPQVFDALAAAMRFSDQQIIVSREAPITIKRPGSGGAISRIKLLRILGERARDLGVDIRYEQRIENFAQLDADVVVGADGINSRVRDSEADAFDVQRASLSNHFAWYGVAKAFPSPSLVFRKQGEGYFVAHYYPYSESMSTFVAECDHLTWRTLGMETMSADERQAVFERVFAPELGGHNLVSNHSTWRQFPVIRARNWHVGNRVLIGDALSSAHFSIGSGTRIAMEDAIALAKALNASPDDIPCALGRYVDERQPQKQKLIGASEASFNWYENIRGWMDAYEPQEFVLRFMTRTGRVDIGRLREQYPALVMGFEAAGLVPAQAGASS
ncbi:FAD-dependent monooxygenase [Achromobacter pestifer]|uniref:Salicyloyl-CoA 5-hydroxylase n=1 Tax=Achromobacter pestifer TaxID=1353889 RepID=A0A6S6YT35_9BURK|nr:FAD-dependent monooxygenase [Achromobacter pestifer]CAB3642254.1 Salicyloyl-CoA 5-hydroxylase [Achromobacter pestifer]